MRERERETERQREGETETERQTERESPPVEVGPGQRDLSTPEPDKTFGRSSLR